MKCGSLQLVIIHTFPRSGDWFRFKDRQPNHLLSVAVSRITCKCKLFYVGETGKCILNHFNEHNKTFGSNLTTVGKHLKSSPTCHIDFENNVESLAKSHFTNKPKIIVTLFIEGHKGDPNLLNDMYLSKQTVLFNI